MDKIVALSQEFSQEDIEWAMKRAHEFKNYGYDALKRILLKHLEAPNSLPTIHPSFLLRIFPYTIIGINIANVQIRNEYVYSGSINGSKPEYGRNLMKSEYNFKISKDRKPKIKLVKVELANNLLIKSLLILLFRYLTKKIEKSMPNIIDTNG